MKILGGLALFVLLFGWMFLWGSFFRHHGYRAGFLDGYARGREDADAWLLGAERGIAEARSGIWQEEERRDCTS